MPKSRGLLLNLLKTEKDTRGPLRTALNVREVYLFQKKRGYFDFAMASLTVLSLGEWHILSALFQYMQALGELLPPTRFLRFLRQEWYL